MMLNYLNLNCVIIFVIIVVLVRLFVIICVIVSKNINLLD